MTWEDDDHPCLPQTERFNDCPQVLCGEGLTGCCYGEAECSGKGFHVGVAYKHMSRVGKGHNCLLGYNDKSWSLRLLKHGFLKLSVWHKNEHTVIHAPSSSTDRVGVYLNSSQGTLSFYLVSSDTHSTPPSLNPSIQHFQSMTIHQCPCARSTMRSKGG